jgi:diacylglycerol O-acyltransferase
MAIPAGELDGRHDRYGGVAVKRLGGWDAVLLYNETPNLHQHTLKVAVVDASDYASREGGDFTFELFRRTLWRRLHLLEPLRYRLVDIPLKLHHPMWLEDSDVDLDYHLRRHRVAAPGGRRELDEAIGEIASTPLDRSHPLWEFHFVEGMANDRFAIIGKVHHSLADGVASANLMARALDLRDAPQTEQDLYLRERYPSNTELLRAAARDHLDQVRALPDLLRYTIAGIRRVRRHHRSVPGLARNFHPPETFINHPVSPQRTFASATLSLADVKETSQHLRVTINDLVLAITAGALRQLQLRYDGHADEPLIGSVPVSINTSPDRISGNQLGAFLVSLPVQTDDPLEWVRLAKVGSTVGKENNELLGPELMSRWSNYIPPALAQVAFRWLSTRDAQNKLLNIPISNVPGPRERGRIAKAPLSEIYSVGPLTIGSGINITVWSYVDQLNISVLEDGATVDDPHEITDAMVDAFVEIRRAAGLPAHLTEVATAM